MGEREKKYVIRNRRFFSRLTEQISAGRNRLLSIIAQFLFSHFAGKKGWKSPAVFSLLIRHFFRNFGGGSIDLLSGNFFGTLIIAGRKCPV